MKRSSHLVYTFAEPLRNNLAHLGKQDLDHSYFLSEKVTAYRFGEMLLEYVLILTVRVLCNDQIELSLSEVFRNSHLVKNFSQRFPEFLAFDQLCDDLHS